jgi:branched-chain amino acid aminotransferase/4-amino-4-deoxychorismate lyase
MASAPHVPLDDRGLLLGDGLFETPLWRRGELVLADDHAARMAAGAAVLDLPPPDRGAFLGVALAAVREAGLGGARAAVRVTYTAGAGGRGLDRPAGPQPRLFATAAPAARPETPARLAIARTRRNERSPASRLKTLGYLDNVLARREAHAAGADEAVMLNTTDRIACAAAANLFWLEEGALFTPAPDCGVLDGIMARQVRSAAERLGLEVREVHAPLTALATAEAIFLTSSLIGVRPAYLGAEPPRTIASIETIAREVAAFI